MANDFYAVADLVADALDLSPAEVSDLETSAPFFSMLPVTPSSNGDTHKYAKETGAPVVGFRAENAGRDFDHSVDTIVTVTLKILDFSWMVDKAVADRWRAGGPEALIAREGRRHLRAAFFKAEQQYINGVTEGDAAGFAGFADASELDALADTMVIDAGGTTAGTGSSVWGVRVGMDDVSAVMIEEAAFNLGETITQNFVDGSNLNLPVYYTPACTWVGIQNGSAKSIGRIANLTEDSGKGLTDDLISDLLAEYPAGRMPTHLLMSRRSLKQLQQSRTATNSTGAPAPFPTESFGVPIVTLDSIADNDALIS